MTIENIKENWNVAHMNISGDVVSAARWLEKHHDEIIGFLLGETHLLQGQLKDFQKQIEIQGSSNIEYLKEIADLKARVEVLRKQLNANCLQRDALMIENANLKKVGGS